MTMFLEFDSSGVAEAFSFCCGIFYVLYLALLIGIIVALWKVYKKAGYPGWASLVPFYNNYVLFEIVYGKGNGWKFLLSLIPIYNIYLMFKLYIDWAKAYGKSTGYGLLLLFFYPFVIFAMAFGNATYMGPRQW